MKRKCIQTILVLGLAAAAWIWCGDMGSRSGRLIGTAQAVIGRPATPVSYAGVARRTTVRVATPGVNTRWNRGGPVNRVGRR